MRGRLATLGVLFWLAAPGCDVTGGGADDPDGGEEGGDCIRSTVAERIGVAGDDAAIDELCDFGGEDEAPPGPHMVGLVAASSCGDISEPIRERLVRSTRREVEQACRNNLRLVCLDGNCSSPDGDVDTDADADMDADGDADEYSTTNVQEAGVDEADFIKNDGTYIYIIAADQLVILRAWPAEALAEVSRTTIEGTPQQLFVYNDQAVVYSYDPSERCYGDYNYDVTSCVTQEARTLVSVLDISDRARPVLVRRIEAPGAYVQSRRIDDAVHTVIASPGRPDPGLTYWIDGACTFRRASEYRSVWEDVLERNLAAIESYSAAIEPPVLTDTLYDATGAPVEVRTLQDDCDGVMMSSHLTGTSFLTVLGIEIGAPASASLTSIVGEQGIVYASSEALYVASRDLPPDGDYVETTRVHRFPFAHGSASVSYQGSGQVPGRALSQFSLGEHEGYLRMATTVGHLPDYRTSNDVYVLHPAGEALEVVGELTDVAPDEDIRSARFVGDRGFLVTFKKTDPLFTLDLSDPTSPEVVGELQIPGFSTYMHMLDDDHILSIGFDAQDEGTFAWFQGVLLQIFDISDMTAPALLHRHVIGTRGTTSEATADHLAFNYFRPREALAIPMGICGESAGGSDYGDEMTFNGLMVFDVSVEDGIAEHGRISHPIAGDPATLCGNWWTEPSSWVRRSVFMEDFVYSVAPDRIIVADLADLSTPVASVDLPTAP